VKQCTHDRFLSAGTWYLWRTGKKKVFLACPTCAGIVMIELDDIDEDGTLVVPFLCRRKGCGFHDRIRLVGWKVPQDE
jgi:hypothetical protein